MASCILHAKSSISLSVAICDESAWLRDASAAPKRPSYSGHRGRGAVPWGAVELLWVRMLSLILSATWDICFMPSSESLSRVSVASVLNSLVRAGSNWMLGPFPSDPAVFFRHISLESLKFGPR